MAGTKSLAGAVVRSAAIAATLASLVLGGLAATTLSTAAKATSKSSPPARAAWPAASRRTEA